MISVQFFIFQSFLNRLEGNTFLKKVEFMHRSTELNNHEFCLRSLPTTIQKSKTHLFFFQFPTIVSAFFIHHSVLLSAPELNVLSDFWLRKSAIFMFMFFKVIIFMFSHLSSHFLFYFTVAQFGGE